MNYKETVKDKLELLTILARAFCQGDVDSLGEVLIDNCKYNSDYAQKRVASSTAIIDNMRRVHDAVQNDIEKGKDSSYSYEIVQVEDILNSDTKLDDLHGDSFFEVCDSGLLLFQYDSEKPVAVVYIKVTPGGKISEINLSRNRKWFNVSFYAQSELDDSDNDIPYTVKPMTPHDIHVKNLQSVFSHQKNEYAELDDDEVYIWRKADASFKQLLNERGYNILESQVFDDCIGYRCKRNNCNYTIYMFAFGQNQTISMDGDYCTKLLDNNLSNNSEVLVAYLNVIRTVEGNSRRYSVCSYSGNTNDTIEFWRVKTVNERNILEFFPRMELVDITNRLMYAFNCDNRDVYECIVCESNPAFENEMSGGVFYNIAFYNRLLKLHKEHGDMKLGYVRFNDVIYSRVPYIEDYGYFSFTVDADDKIQKLVAHPFDGGERKYAEIIKTNEKEDGTLFDNIPLLSDVSAFEPVFTERFALKLHFDNGECRKYVLPSDINSEGDEVVTINEHVFTNKIWASAKVEASSDPARGMAVTFTNGYSISVLKCYENSTQYSEPEICNDVVYEDQDFYVERSWKWNAKSVYREKETEPLRVLIKGAAFNYDGISTFASLEGERICSIDFDYLSSFNEGLAQVGRCGYGYGYVDKDLNLVIPMIYENASDFEGGTAKVKKNGEWIIIDKRGNRIDKSTEFSHIYQDIGNFSEGMCRVSTLKLGFMDLAYHSDYAEIAGIWGYINDEGEEIVSPQYIYAEDFCGGVAIACKGEWTIDEKWNNKFNSGRYWTETELWGGIDKNGNEVIPFIFDEIKEFWADDGVFMAHYGGWENGKWGVIDSQGKWLADPIFEDIDYSYKDGLFAFYNSDKWSDGSLLGIYDINQQQVVLEPQFEDVSFMDDGWIEVELFDKVLGRNVEKIIDIYGNEKFPSNYSSIYTWRKPYEVVIRDKDGDRHGLINEDGTEVLPCKYDVVWRGISYEQKVIVYKENEKCGIKDFDGNILVEPKYYELRGIDNPLLIVRVGDKDNYKEGMITRNGTEVIPAIYHSIRWINKEYFVCCGNEGCEMHRMIFY